MKAFHFKVSRLLLATVLSWGGGCSADTAHIIVSESEPEFASWETELPGEIRKVKLNGVFLEDPSFHGSHYFTENQAMVEIPVKVQTEHHQTYVVVKFYLRMHGDTALARVVQSARTAGVPLEDSVVHHLTPCVRAVATSVMEASTSDEWPADIGNEIRGAGCSAIDPIRASVEPGTRIVLSPYEAKWQEASVSLLNGLRKKAAEEKAEEAAKADQLNAERAAQAEHQHQAEVREQAKQAELQRIEAWMATHAPLKYAALVEVKRHHAKMEELARVRNDKEAAAAQKLAESAHLKAEAVMIRARIAEEAALEAAAEPGTRASSEPSTVWGI